MIKLWTASPKKFDKFDFERIGTGTGIARHGDGMYLGDKKLALEYLKDYDGFFGADLSILYKGREVNGVAREVLEYLSQNGKDIDQAIEYFSGQEEHLRIAQRPNLLNQVEFHYGMLAEVEIPNVAMSDFPHWEDEVPLDELDAIAMTFLSDVVTRDQVLEYRQRFDDLGIDIDDFETLEEVIDELFDQAYEVAVESDELSISIDDDDLRECWNNRIRRDEYSTTNFDDDFYHTFPKKHLSLLDELCKDGLILEKDSNLTYGSLYEITASQLDLLQDQGRDLSGLTARSMMEKVGIDGLRAPAIKSDADAEELVIYSKALVESAKIKPELVSNFDLNHHSQDFYL